MGISIDNHKSVFSISTSKRSESIKSTSLPPGTLAFISFSFGVSTVCKNTANKHSALDIVKRGSWAILKSTSFSSDKTPKLDHSSYFLTQPTLETFLCKDSSKSSNLITTPTIRPAIVCSSSGVKSISSCSEVSLRFRKISSASIPAVVATSRGWIPSPIRNFSPLDRRFRASAIAFIVIGCRDGLMPVLSRTLSPFVIKGKGSPPVVEEDTINASASCQTEKIEQIAIIEKLFISLLTIMLPMCVQSYS
mmetsp:Transcript_32870/g.49597  ORF Transcript_32870/g.49597 Transcript_32870/m.49597 type:complete len:250 (+) Transcript_32870:320-1069(+)